MTLGSRDVEVEIEAMLLKEFSKYRNAFRPLEGPNNLPPSLGNIDLRIDFIKGYKLSFARPYTIGPRELEVVRKHV